jgi:hypothetical protein
MFPRMSKYASFSSTAIAAATLSVAVMISCKTSSSSSFPADAAPGGLDASSLPDVKPAEVTDASDAMVVEAAVEAEAAPVEAAGPPQSFVRIANFTPDAPAVGFDFCLAPSGTTSWVGPLLGQDLPPASLGQGGGPNGIQFAAVSAYFPVTPGQYDLQLVQAGATSCATGVIPVMSGVPALTANAYTTFATIGDVNPTDDDAAMKVAAFADDVTVASGSTSLRVINAIPSVAAIDVGTGSLRNDDFTAIFTLVPFGAPGMTLADGGAPDFNGYVTLSPMSGALFSAHQSSVGTADLATATNVSLKAGSVTTMALINGKNSGPPPQFLVCTDNGAAVGSESPCNVVAQ